MLKNQLVETHLSNKFSSDNITVLTSIGPPMSKHIKADGTIKQYENAFNFKHSTAPVANIFELFALLKSLENNPRACIIRGGFIGSDLAETIVSNIPGVADGCVVRRQELFKDRRLHACMIDIDNFLPSASDPLENPQASIDEFTAKCLPTCFIGVTYAWQLSSTMGLKKNSGKLKAHVWFWLETPYTSAELRAWAKQWPEVDQALFEPVQVHYTARPTFDEGFTDPLSVRSGLVEGLFGDVVPLVLSADVVAASRVSLTVETKEVLDRVMSNDDIARRLDERGMIKSRRADGSLNIVCPRESQHSGLSGETSSIYYPAFTGGFKHANFDCKHTSCRGVEQQVFRDLMRESALDGLDAESELADAETSMADVQLSRLMAEILVGKYLYDHSSGNWLMLDRGLYKPCALGEVQETAKQLGPKILQNCKANVGDSDKAARTMRMALRAMSAAGINAALSLAQSDPRLATSSDRFDTDPDALNTLNGVVDLLTTLLQPHGKGQRFKRQCPVEYDPLARAILWERFLLEISCNDPDWVDFVQRALGYTLTGHVSEEMIFFMIGHGANGKSVFANVVRRILGQYATAVTANFLSQSKRDGEAATPSLATLPGARMALANEIEAGSKLSAQMVKVATSTEQIAARHNYKSVFNFVPTHKSWVRGNHKPIIQDTDEGIWRRVVLILFERNFAPHERDMRLEEKLMAEAPGILAWMVRGCMEYRRRGLQPTGRIAQASAAYRAESDLLGQWIEDEAEVGAGLEVAQGLAYERYRSWCLQQGLHPISKKSFTRSLIERGIKEGQATTGTRPRLYRGLKINDMF